jgi:Protein of unknown function (DUF3027)
MKMNDPFNAVEIARAAALEDAGNEKFVGNFVSADADVENRITTYLFESFVAGYTGWRWAVTIIKLDDEAPATICDVVLLPGADALLAPEWIPYKDRVLPGDVGVGDILPTSADDVRLVPGFAALPGDEELDPAQLFEFGLGRARVLSIEGRDQASKRWHEGDRGPNTSIAQHATKACGSCGFFLPIAGSLRSAFGVCANALAPDDARVVSVDHGCGAHSEALVVAE